MNTTDFLEIASAICPDRTAIIFEDRRYSFMELAERVNRLANALAGLGVGHGDTVALLQVNAHQCVETYFAVSKLGGIYVPLNFRARANELSYMISTAETRTVLVGDRYVPMIEGIKGDIPNVKNFIALDGAKEGWLAYEEVIASASDEPVFAEVGEEDTSLLMYTAGTTGFPKGVMLSHNSFISYVMTNVSPVDPDVDERNILSVPLYHIAGIQAMMAAIYGGRTLIIERQFDPVEWMTLVEKERADRSMMVPTMLKQLMEHPEFRQHDLSSLKVITYGAAPMPLEVISRALEEFPNTQFINAFGQTETAATITALAPEDHVIPANLPEAERQKRLKRLSSVGRALPDVEVKVVDEYGNDCTPEGPGEVIARGPRVMQGYWRDEAKTASTLKSGWIYTGDLGYMDEEGYLFLTGRASDVIIRAGENISPEEVEGVIEKHPAVGEVSVFGVPDPTWGENVAAAVVLKPGAQATETELIEYCRQNLASYKRPSLLVFVPELPRNPMGKVLRRELRAQFGAPAQSS